ncbi:MAG: hypothetical protein WC956_06880 [bacterium]
MTAKKIKTAIADKRDSENYMKRSMELRQSMRNNLVLENWNALVIDAVHAVISANDALTVALAGVRCTSSNHLDAVELLKQSISKELQPDIARLARVISIKSHVEYGPSLVTRTEAEKIAKDAERFIDWTESVLQKVK